MLIIGSFASSGQSIYDQHYIFIGVQTPNERYHLEAFPKEGSVRIQGGQSKFNMTWTADTFGYFKITNDTCEAVFTLNNNTLRLNTSNRIPWSLSDPSTDGPEGWLTKTTLLPCHYFIYSVGSDCTYSFQNSEIKSHKDTNFINGTGYTHIEGNHGKNP